MAKMECDKDMEIPIIDEYIKIMSEAEGKEVKMEYLGDIGLIALQGSGR